MSKKTTSWTENYPCPVCGSHQQMTRGTGERCHGYESSNGRWAFCARDEHADGVERNLDGLGKHALGRTCPCGADHGAGGARVLRPAARGGFVEAYHYCDESGNTLYAVERYADKSFFVTRPDPRDPSKWISGLGEVRRVPFNLPNVIKAVEQGHTVYITEGEKDALAVNPIRGDVTATCNLGGAGKWRDEYSRHLEGADVVIVADDDEVGARPRTGASSPRPLYLTECLLIGPKENAA
jgi:hypothetical protein